MNVASQADFEARIPRCEQRDDTNGSFERHPHLNPEAARHSHGQEIEDHSRGGELCRNSGGFGQREAAAVGLEY
jgi:hypothetical protein